MDLALYLLCPQLQRSCGSILVSGCLSVHCIRHACVCSSKTVHARVLKFHIWIPHGKIADTHFFSSLSYLPFWSYVPVKKEWNLMHAISYELACYGFEISYMDSWWKNSWPVFCFLSELSPFLELCPIEKIRMKSCQQGTYLEKFLS